MPLQMVVIAGAPGSGKSTAFPVSGEGIDFFNADDQAAQRNDGSYRGISPAIRHLVNREFEDFVADHLRRRESFAIETTLRSDITFRQARQAREAGFDVVMRYLGLRDVELSLERVRARADAGGHAASASTLRSIHKASLGNLPIAIRELNQVIVYDNSRAGGPPDLLVTSRNGTLTYVCPSIPEWLTQALHGSEFQLR